MRRQWEFARRPRRFWEAGYSSPLHTLAIFAICASRAFERDPCRTPALLANYMAALDGGRAWWVSMRAGWGVLGGMRDMGSVPNWMELRAHSVIGQRCGCCQSL